MKFRTLLMLLIVLFGGYSAWVGWHAWERRNMVARALDRVKEHTASSFTDAPAVLVAEDAMRQAAIVIGAGSLAGFGMWALVRMIRGSDSGDVGPFVLAGGMLFAALSLHGGILSLPN